MMMLLVMFGGGKKQGGQKVIEMMGLRFLYQEAWLSVATVTVGEKNGILLC